MVAREGLEPPQDNYIDTSIQIRRIIESPITSSPAASTNFAISQYYCGGVWRTSCHSRTRAECNYTGKSVPWQVRLATYAPVRDATIEVAPTQDPPPLATHTPVQVATLLILLNRITDAT